MFGDSSSPIPQSGVIPYRWQEDVLEVLLITSIRRKRWIFPKGWLEPGLTPQQSAAQEAFEEAGVHGLLTDEALGTYAYNKHGSDFVVTMYPMLVTEVLEHWPEKLLRERVWCTLDEALNRLQIPDLRVLLQTLASQLMNRA